MKSITPLMFLLVLGLSCSEAAQWSSSLPEGAVVDACAGDENVRFPWQISLASGEDIQNIEWFYNGHSQEMIATFTHGHFLSMPTYSQRVQYVSNAGLALNYVTEGDAGNYSVEVVTKDTSGTFSALRHSAVLVVSSEATAATDATLSIEEQRTAVYDNQTGQYHVQLTCTSQGRQPPAVIWTDPSGSAKVVLDNESGQFSLLIPNPVTGGNYTCRVYLLHPAAHCLPRDAPQLEGATVVVDEMRSRLTLIEATQKHLQSENNELKVVNAHLSSENSLLKSRLDQHLEEYHDVAIKQVSFHTRLHSNAQLSSGQRLILPHVLYNQGADAAQWSSSLPEGAVVDACAGDTNVRFPWAITLTAGEEITNIEWFFNGHSQEMISTFTHGNFLPMPTFSQRVQYLPNAGLKMNYVTEGDAGNYSVEVITRDTSGTLSTLRHSAILVVSSEAKAATDATLFVKEQATAVYDNQTGQYHVQLTCTSHGRQPPAVIWMDPSGSSKVVSDSEAGKFSLLIPNPVAGGNYTCRVPPTSPAAQCLPKDAPQLEGATVFVDEIRARLVLIEATQIDLQHKNSKLEAENIHLTSSVQDLQTENSQLKSRLDHLSQEHHDEASKRVGFHARLNGSINLSRGQHLILPNVLYNQGNGYNPSTGIFTVPFNGTYIFLVSTVPIDSFHFADVQLKVDGTVVNDCPSNTSGDVKSCNAIVHLNASQTVWLESRGFCYFQNLGTTFFGFLISPDM